MHNVTKVNGADNTVLTVTGEVRSGHILDGNLFEEGRFLTARVSTDHPGLLQPLTQPGQVTVTDIWVGQQVTVDKIRLKTLKLRIGGLMVVR